MIAFVAGLAVGAVVAVAVYLHQKASVQATIAAAVATAKVDAAAALASVQKKV